MSMTSLASDFEKVPLSTSFFEASANVKKRSEFHDFLELRTIKSTTNRAYLGAAKALMAEVVSNPYTKLSYFNDGKKLIDQAIKMDPKNAELRYLRFMIQQNTPDFLNYSDDINADFEILKREIENTTTRTSWMKELSEYLKTNKPEFKV
ncbi:hypothetical protein N8Z73_00795 [bacterium]|nr:hypothetical protein [bacterium]